MPALRQRPPGQARSGAERSCRYRRVTRAGCACRKHLELNRTAAQQSRGSARSFRRVIPLAAQWACMKETRLSQNPGTFDPLLHSAASRSNHELEVNRLGRLGRDAAGRTAGAGTNRNPVVALDDGGQQRVGQRPGQGIQCQPEELQGRAHLQGQLRRIDDRGSGRLPLGQCAAHPAGLRGRHSDDDGQQGRGHAGRQDDGGRRLQVRPRLPTCRQSPATTPPRPGRC